LFLVQICGLGRRPGRAAVSRYPALWSPDLPRYDVPRLPGLPCPAIVAAAVLARWGGTMPGVSLQGDEVQAPECAGGPSSAPSLRQPATIMIIVGRRAATGR